MTTQPTTTTKQAIQIAAVIAGGLVSFNAAFYFLSSFYFRDRPGIDDIGSVRGAFAVLTVIVAAATFTAALAPRLIGHVLAVLVGGTSLVAGYFALRHGLPGVMGVTLLVVGVVMPVLAWKSWEHSRPAWAFLIAIMAVFGAVDFFGAPKVRGLLGIGLWTALIVPGLQIIGVIALTMVRGEYREGAADSKSVLPTEVTAAKTP